ncbi:MAG: PEP-utilizing enzyme [Chloroflexi bacterium]|nr:PEP-utilizing enzyme [Chloroflexota bacterium]
MQTVVGKPASPGIAIGPSFVFAGQELVPPRFTVSETELEFARLEQALAKAVAEVEALRRVADERVGAEEAAIFDAHALIIQDPVLLKDIRRVIEVQHVNAEAAWADTIEANAAKLDALGSEYLRARAADIRDVGRRILRILLGVDVQDLSEMAAPGIVVARDLTPSDTVNLTRSLVLGFCTAEGGPTSHTAILAKALGLPAVVGAGQPVLVLPSGTRLIVDGSQGIVVMDPTEAALEDSRVRREEMLYRSER